MHAAGEHILVDGLRSKTCSFLIFSALHGMPVWTSDEKGVCPSDVLSVTKWKKDLSKFLYHTKDILPSLQLNKKSALLN